MLLVCTLWLFSNLYTLNKVIWDENSPHQSYSVVVTRSGFLIDSNIKVYIKKQGALLRSKLFEEHLIQDLRSVSTMDIFTRWMDNEECILYIQGESEYIQATISVESNGQITCDYIKQSLF